MLYVLLASIILVPLALIACQLLSYRRLKYRGPQIFYPFIGHLPQLRTNPHRLLFDWSLLYGKVFKIQLGMRNGLVLNSTQSMREFFVDHEETFSGRPQLPTIRAVNLGSLSSFTFQPYNTKWRLMRKTAMKALGLFGSSRNSRLESVCHASVTSFIHEVKASEAVPMDIASSVFECVASVLATICFGTQFERDDIWLQDFRRISKENSRFIGLQNYADFLPGVVSALFLKEQYEGLRRNRAYVNKFVGERMAQCAERTGDVHDIAGALHRALRDSQDAHSDTAGLLASHLRAIAADLFAAGFTTTTETILWSFLLTAAHPAVQKKVHEDIDAMFGLDDNPIGTDAMDRLPYVRATLAEVLRFAPVVPLSLFHTAETDALVEGNRVPRDTVIIPNIWAANHDAAEFSEPHRFMPERFLFGNGEFQHGLTEQVTTFGVGKRRCPGENLARQQIFLFFVNVLRHFWIDLGPNEDRDALVTTANGGFNLKPKPHCLVFTSRKVALKLNQTLD